MEICFTTVEVPLQRSPLALEQVILQTLRQQGEPLRWAIVGVDGDRQFVTVEAVVTTEFPLLNAINPDSVESL